MLNGELESMDAPLADEPDPLLGRIEPPRSLRDLVLDTLRQQLISGALAPGQRLRERDIAAALGVSVTPVKEALRTLEQNGLVRVEARRGTFVSELVNTPVAEVYAVRGAIESLAARFTAQKITDAQIDELGATVATMRLLATAENVPALIETNAHFHALIRDFTANPMLRQIWDNAMVIDHAVRQRAYRHPSEIQQGLADHVGIYQAIADREPERAETLMRHHVERGTADVLPHHD
jgi:DNA-binding GntR family transcriptional regulator